MALARAERADLIDGQAAHLAQLPSTIARASSLPTIQAAEARQRKASKTSVASAARSFDPAKRCEGPNPSAHPPPGDGAVFDIGENFDRRRRSVHRRRSCRVTPVG